jgi:uncharacterized membrane protein
MESKVKLLGHPVHPILVVFPLGLLVTSVIFDLLFYFLPVRISPEVGFWMAVSGIIGGFISAVFGLIDWLAIPAQTRAKKIGLIHAGANVFVLIFFIISVYIRLDNPRYSPDAVAMVLSVAGLLLGFVGGWTGGELVHRLNVGNDSGANLEAPNSIWGENPTYQIKRSGREYD